MVKVESVTDSYFAKLLDQESGIDAWQVHVCGIRGLSSRVQAEPPLCRPAEYPYNTFTIRMSRDSGVETEYVKRKRAIESGEKWLYPYLHCQAYVDKKKAGKLLSVALAKMKDIIEFIDKRHCQFNKADNATFAVIHWEDYWIDRGRGKEKKNMKDLGYKIKIWKQISEGGMKED